MKVAIVAESFLPQTNGVVNSVLRVLDHLQNRGDEVLVIAPDAADGQIPRKIAGARIATVPSWSLPGYADVRVATGGSRRIAALLDEFQPDVVHLASPFVLGWRAALAAADRGYPIVAVYQTDVPAYAARYGMAWSERLLWRRVRDIHDRATLTLVPSTASYRTLDAQGIARLHLWRRGVDVERFSPLHRDEEFRRRRGAPERRVVGFVGRLAPEKQVADLAPLHADPDLSLVIVGDGPDREELQRQMPRAHFTGLLRGADLGRVMASLDVLVHTGESETFCQVIQEAMASGVPVVATGVGGPVDLVDHSRTGWLYRPGDLAGMHGFVRDLTGDEAKRHAFRAAARASVLPRRWSAIGGHLIGYYAQAIDAHAVDGPLRVPRLRRHSKRNTD